MKRLSVLMLLVSLAFLVAAQNPPATSPLEEMVATERAFARTSEEKGTAPSFLAFIADDGILFRPKAVKGKQWMIENPPPASDKRPWLKWEPTFAHMARAGDMGYTFGPWEYRRDIKDAEPVAFGHFLTVWKKQPDGTWKFAVDLGISHPKPSIRPRSPLKMQEHATLAQRNQLMPKRETDKLLAKDKEVSGQSAASTAAEAFKKNATKDVRLFREGKFPKTGVKLRRTPHRMSGRGRPKLLTCPDQATSVTAMAPTKFAEGATLKETGNYMRIWKKEGGEWKVAVDLANPIVDRKN